eukprot:INCI5728.1.p1 GENE.INCI5728.1~~INCI5728.1.p1  ORF type:complete len:489 (-),score=87.25 INCI5728.1:1256-2722(-)
MDGTVFGFGVVGAIVTISGGYMFLGQSSRMSELALIPTTVALTKSAIKFKRAKNHLIASSEATAALLDDSVDAVITGTVERYNGQYVAAETGAGGSNRRTTNGEVAAVKSTVTRHGAAAAGVGGSETRLHLDDWATFTIRDSDGTGEVVCPKHIFKSNSEIPKPSVAHERWGSEQSWFGAVEVKKIASFKESLERSESEVGYDVREEILPFGSTVTLHGRVRLSDDRETLVVERPVTLSQDSRGVILSELLLRSQRTKWVSVALMAGGLACVGYAVYRFRTQQRARARSKRRHRSNSSSGSVSDEDDLLDDRDIEDDDEDDDMDSSDHSHRSMDAMDRSAQRLRRGAGMSVPAAGGGGARGRGAGRRQATWQQHHHQQPLMPQMVQHSATAHHHAEPLPMAVVSGGTSIDSGEHVGGGASRGGSHAAKPSLDDMCIICLSDSKNAVLVPCGHQSMCHDCALEWLMSNPMRQCPICRQRVKRVQKIFRT